ncbi:MAG: hypothetical protein ACHQK9_22180, partial [Reyranellales bacterium]
TNGGPFNQLVEPDPVNIAGNEGVFQAAWSPSQYMLPHALEQAGLSLGLSVSIVTIAFTVLGLVGWYKAYRLWGFPETTSAVAIAIVACTRALALPFGTYNGGEVLLFGCAPWFVALLWRWRCLSVFQSLALVLAICVLAFAKLSGLIFAYSALAAVVVFDLWPPSLGRLRRPIMAGLIAATFGVAFYFLWLSRGWTAADGNGAMAWLALPLRAAEGIAATFMGMLSLGDVAARALRFPGHPLIDTPEVPFLVMSLPALAVAAYAGRRLIASHREYLRFALATAVFYIAAMAFIYARGGELGLDERFFRPLSLTLFVGVVHAFVTSGDRVRRPMALLAGLAMVYGVGSYVVHLVHNVHSLLSDRGFRHYILTEQVRAQMKKELAGTSDRKDAIVYVPSPEIALEFPQARAVTSTDETLDELKRLKINGRVRRVVVLLPAADIANGRGDIFLRSFVDYDRTRWTGVTVDGFVVFTQ